MIKSTVALHGGFLRLAVCITAAVITGSPLVVQGAGRANPSADAVVVAHKPTWDRSRLGSIDQRVLDLALNAAGCAVRSGKITSPSTLTVIDYSKPSTQKRLWVIDLRTHALLFEELVAHGQGSGNNIPTHFSNEAETHRSSIGLFETKDTYIGKNGYSLRLDGLDTGFNDHAMERAIVIHGAAYVSDAVVRKQGRLGRSWGCPALREGVAHDLIDAVKESGLVFAYYPDPNWLASSQFFGSCDGNPGATGVTPTVTIG